MAATGAPDAIVVGAGLNGSWAAKELTASGMRVAVLDAGPILRDALFNGTPDTADMFDPRYHLFRLKMLLKGDRQRAFNKFVDRTTNQLYLDRAEHPYATPPGHDFSWSRVRAVGGRGHLWGRVMLRFTDDQFGREGHEWPVRAADLAPFYADVEQMMELGGAASGTDAVPDGHYVHPRSLSSIECQFRDAVSARWPSRHFVVNHVAQYAPSPLSPMLQAAAATDLLDLRPGTVVASLHTGANGVVDGVNTVDTATGARSVVRAPIVVLAASAFESVRTLLNSASDHHPGGIGNSSGLLGTRILEHIMASVLDRLPASAISKTPQYHHNSFRLNEEPHGFYMPSYAEHEHPEDGPFGYGVQGTISTDTGLFYVGAFGETRPSDTNRLRIDPNRVDAHGIPVAAIDYQWSAEDVALFDRANRSISEMIGAFQADSGLKLRNPMTTKIYNHLAAERPVPGSNHECGGARMGTDPASSVVDTRGRLWDAPNVLVCDSSVFPSIPHQNPTLTSMALTVRAMRSLLVSV